MDSKFVPKLWVSLMCLFALSGLAAAAPLKGLNLQDNKQDQKKDQGPQLSNDERAAIDKINKASGPEAKLKASAEYSKKFSKSTMRPKVADYVAGEIGQVKDNNQKIKLSQDFASIFNQPGEADLVKPYLIEAYFNANKFDEALNESSKYLEKNPEDVPVLVQIAWAGANQAQKQPANPKLTQAALQASAKAVELMEADKKPARMDDKAWAEYRNSWLWRLYQARGVILFTNNDKVGAKESMEKAVGIEPNEPTVLLMLSNIASGDYQTLAEQYQKEKKQELYDKAIARMDEAIDWMARFVAATDGNAQYKDLNQQVLENLKQYYSFRNNGKTDGLTGLIEKYKKKG
jgi:tetratricopeptide (TPR) repeat protein